MPELCRFLLNYTSMVDYATMNLVGKFYSQ